jgi:hypothetical protein
MLLMVVLSLAVTTASASPTAFSLASGPTGTSAFGFAGGWGLNAAVEVPIAPAASFVARADFHRMPEREAAAYAYPLDATSIGDIGRGPAETASLMGLFAGLRLHAPSGRVRPYLDGMVGVGHVSDGGPVVSFPGAGGTLEQRDDTNAALSFGPGVRYVTAGADLFVDAHYDFYFARGEHIALVPIRMGVSLP